MTSIAGLMTWFGISVVRITPHYIEPHAEDTKDLHPIPRWVAKTRTGPQKFALQDVFTAIRCLVR